MKKIRSIVFDVVHYIDICVVNKSVTFGNKYVQVYIPIPLWFREYFNARYDFDTLLYWKRGWGGKSRNVWNTYFDYGLGMLVSSSAVLRSKEREGYKMTSFSEAERMSKIYKKRASDELGKKIEKEVDSSLREIANGRSYHKEMVAQARKDDSLKAKRYEVYG